MTIEPNNGAFYIPAEDITSTTSFTVPGDKVGETPEGTDNEPQPSYDVDGRQRAYAKQYFIFIKNGWDADLEFTTRGSHFDDRNMDEAVIEETKSSVQSGESCVLTNDTGFTFMDVEINGLTEVPSTGTLKIVFQSRLQ